MGARVWRLQVGSGQGASPWAIDTMSLVFQVFHAVPEMTSPGGQPVNAVFGFTRDLFAICAHVVGNGVAPTHRDIDSAVRDHADAPSDAADPDAGLRAADRPDSAGRHAGERHLLAAAVGQHQPLQRLRAHIGDDHIGRLQRLQNAAEIVFRFPIAVLHRRVEIVDAGCNRPRNGALLVGRIAAHQFGCAEENVTFASGAASDNAGHALNWAELVNIAHRNYHLLPQDMEPGLEATHVMQVPTGNKLPSSSMIPTFTDRVGLPQLASRSG